MAKRKRRKPKSKHKIDIVIPVYGRPDLLQKCLQSIQNQGDIGARIILVDDCGPDQAGLSNVYHSLNSHTKLVRNAENLGFPRSINRGVAAGNSQLILILNTDIELEPGAIQIMMAELENKEVGAVGPKLLFPEGTPFGPAGKVQHAGLAVNFGGQVIHANIGWSADHPKVNERREMQALTGACLMTKREVWRKVVNIYRGNGDPTSGALNEVYGRGTYEDVEFCFVTRSLDYKVVYQPLAVGTHFVGGSSAIIKEGFPLGRNDMIFRARCGGLLAWDEWRFL